MATHPTPADINFETANPILRVADMKRSIDYYTGVLGFTLEPWGKQYSTFAMVTRGRAGIYLCQGAQGAAGTWVWIGVGDVAALYAQYRSAGAAIHMEPKNFSWAYEMRLRDPDGHILRFGSDPLRDKPFEDHLA